MKHPIYEPDFESLEDFDKFKSEELRRDTNDIDDLDEFIDDILDEEDFDED